MKKEFNLLLLNKGYFVYDLNVSNYCNSDLVNYISLSLSTLGFKLCKKSYDILMSLSVNDLKVFYDELFCCLSTLKGNNVNHVIFYKDFPNMEKYDEFDYLLRAL